MFDLNSFSQPNPDGGQIDRYLVRMGMQHSGSSAGLRAEIEKIWCEILNVPSVREADHFAELGGDSIAAAVCVNRIHAELGLEIGVELLLSGDSSFGQLVAAAGQPHGNERR